VCSCNLMHGVMHPTSGPLNVTFVYGGADTGNLWHTRDSLAPDLPLMVVSKIRIAHCKTKGGGGRCLKMNKKRMYELTTMLLL
jgi:hypothetical protein